MDNNRYLLLQQQGQISVYRYADKKLTLLKFKGETKQEYGADPDRFWRAFKEKMAYYDNAPLGFIVLSDQETLPIPDSINLCHSDDFHPPILRNVSELGDITLLNQFTHPPLEEFELRALAETPLEITAEAEVVVVENAPIITPQDYFNKKTRDYKNS